MTLWCAKYLVAVKSSAQHTADIHMATVIYWPIPYNRFEHKITNWRNLSFWLGIEADNEYHVEEDCDDIEPPIGELTTMSEVMTLSTTIASVDIEESLSDDDFLDYCDRVVKTERCGLVSPNIARLCRLSGRPLIARKWDRMPFEIYQYQHDIVRKLISEARILIRDSNKRYR